MVIVGRSELEQYRDPMPQTATLQLISPDHLRRGDDFVYTEFLTLEF